MTELFNSLLQLDLTLRGLLPLVKSNECSFNFSCHLLTQHCQLAFLVALHVDELELEVTNLVVQVSGLNYIASLWFLLSIEVLWDFRKARIEGFRIERFNLFGTSSK